MLENIKPMLTIAVKNKDACVEVSKINDNFYTAELFSGKDILLRTAFATTKRSIGVAALGRLETLIGKNLEDDPATEFLSKERAYALLLDIKAELVRWMDADEKGLCVPEQDTDKKTEIFVTQGEDSVELLIRRPHTVDERIRIGDNGPVSVIVEDRLLRKYVPVYRCPKILYDKNAPIYDYHNDFAAFRNAFPETRLMDRYAISEYMTNHEKACFLKITNAIEKVRVTMGNCAALELFDHTVNPPALISYGVHQNTCAYWSLKGDPVRIYLQDEKLMVDYINKPESDATLTAEICCFEQEHVEQYDSSGTSPAVTYENARHIGRDVVDIIKRKR